MNTPRKSFLIGIVSATLAFGLLGLGSLSAPSAWFSGWSPPRPDPIHWLMLACSAVVVPLAFVLLRRRYEQPFNPTIKVLPLLVWLTAGVLSFGLTSCGTGTILKFGKTGIEIIPPTDPIIIPVDPIK